jgi:hypothetical protein
MLTRKHLWLPAMAAPDGSNDGTNPQVTTRSKAMKTHRHAKCLAIGLLGLVIFPESGYALTDVFAVHHNTGFISPGQPFATLIVDGGKYAVIAKINLNNDSGSAAGDVRTITCSLKAQVTGQPTPNILDETQIRVQVTGSDKLDLAAIHLLSPATFTQPKDNKLTLSCTFTGTGGSGISLAGAGARILAIRIDGQLCYEEGSASCP